LICCEAPRGLVKPAPPRDRGSGERGRGPRQSRKNKENECSESGKSLCRKTVGVEKKKRMCKKRGENGGNRLGGKGRRKKKGKRIGKGKEKKEKMRRNPKEIKR